MSVQGVTMPPPSMGLDLVSPIDNMEPAAALELSNVFPGAGAPSVRLGYEQVVSLSETTPIGFMRELPRPSGNSQLIVANTTKIYSISTGHVATNISKTGGYTSSNWHAEVFANNIYLCNGVDNAQVYAGNTGTPAQDLNASFSGGGSTLDKLINVNAYRERLYFVEKDTFKVWFHDTVRAIFVGAGSALKSYDFQYAMKRGGYLLFTTTYTNQTADTSDDYFVAVSSEGEIIMFSGYSPDDPAWKPVGHFFIGKPLGRKSYLRMGQDVWIITSQGIVPLSALFQTDPEQVINVVSKPVNPLISEFASLNNFGNSWHGFFWSNGRRAYISIPDSGGTAFLLVYSIDTKAWTQFNLLDGSHCVMSTVFNSFPYYGSYTGKIYKGEYNYADNVVGTNGGESITFKGRLAFSFYGSRGNYKAFKDVRPLLKSRRGITLGLALDTDFKQTENAELITTPISKFTAWGSPWGVGAGTINPFTLAPMTPVFTAWSSDVEYIYDRYAIAGQGHCAAIRFSGTIKNTPLQFLGFEVRYMIGGQV